MNNVSDNTNVVNFGSVKPVNPGEQQNKVQQPQTTETSPKVSEQKLELQKAQTDKQDKENAPTAESILEELKSVNQQFPLKSTNLVFEFDDANDPPIIKVVDKENGEVIREIPPKELREIAQALSEIADNLSSGSGILFNGES